MSRTLDEDAATRVIVEYMTERHAWERAAQEQSRQARMRGLAADLESEAQIQAGYAQLLARHCAPRVISLGLRYHYRDPPSVDPAGTRIVSVARYRGAIRVRTEEQQPGGFAAETYEYDLTEVEDQLKISERRARFQAERPIRDVW